MVDQNFVFQRLTRSFERYKHERDKALEGNADISELRDAKKDVDDILDSGGDYVSRMLEGLSEEQSSTWADLERVFYERLFDDVEGAISSEEINEDPLDYFMTAKAHLSSEYARIIEDYCT